MRLLTPKDVAEILCCSAPHVRYLMDAGELPFITIPGTTRTRKMRRVAPEALDQFVQCHASEPSFKGRILSSASPTSLNGRHLNEC